MHINASVQLALCLVGCLHLITFTSLLLQSPLLFGRNGVQPIYAFLNASAEQLLPDDTTYAQKPWYMFQHNPTLLWFHQQLGLTADAMFSAMCLAGAAAAFIAACGIAHPLLLGTLWALYLSAVNVGQAFLPQPGDAVLLEVTFACIWLSLSTLSDRQQAVQQHNDEVDQDTSLQPDTKTSAAASASSQRQPAVALLHWLLFKLLLLSGSTRAFAACLGADGLAECYKVLAAHGQPHVFTWLLQAMPTPVATVLGALAVLEFPAAFLVLCPAPVMQAPVAVTLVIQITRAVLGSNALLHLAAAALCVAVLDEGWVLSALQHMKEMLQRSMDVKAEAHEQHRPLVRTGSNDSLASIMSLEEMAPQPSSTSKASLLHSATVQASAAMAALLAALTAGNSSSTGRILWLTRSQLTAALHYLVPAAALLWLAGFVRACWQSLTQARSAAEAAVKELNQRAKAAAEAAAQATAAASMPAAGSAARVKPSQAKVATAAEMLPSPVVARPITVTAVQQSAAAAAVATAVTDAPEGANIETGTQHAAAAAVQDNEDGSTPHAAGRRRVPAKAAAPSGTPHKGRPAKSSSRTTAATEADEGQEHHDDAATPPVAKATRRGGAAAARSKKAAPAAAMVTEVDKEEQEDTAAAASAAVKTPAAAAAPAAVIAGGYKTPAAGLSQLHPAAAAAATPAAGTVAAAAAMQYVPTVSLWERLAPRLNVMSVAAVVAAVLFVFVAGLPAVLIPAGYSPAVLRSVVPGLLDIYRSSRALGIVSSSSTYDSAWRPTAAAAEQLPGSYLALLFSISEDGQTWKPVQFKHGFGTAGLGGTSGLFDMVGAVRGVYQPKLQGQLAAAGAGSLKDNLWLLSLADMVLEGSAELAPFLAQPLQPHNWVKVDLVRYSPSSLKAKSQQLTQLNGDDTVSWLVQHVAEVLPALPKADEGLKQTLAAMGWALDAQASRPFAGVLSAQVTHPGWLLSVLLLLVALRHCLLPGGLIHSVALQASSK